MANHLAPLGSPNSMAPGTNRLCSFRFPTPRLDVDSGKKTQAWTPALAPGNWSSCHSASRGGAGLQRSNPCPRSSLILAAILAAKKSSIASLPPRSASGVIESILICGCAVQPYKLPGSEATEIITIQLQFWCLQRVSLLTIEDFCLKMVHRTFEPGSLHSDGGREKLTAKGAWGTSWPRRSQQRRGMKR